MRVYFKDNKSYFKWLMNGARLKYNIIEVTPTKKHFIRVVYERL